MAQVVETITPIEVVSAEEVQLLRGFVDIVAEFYGYRYGLVAIRDEMNRDETVSSLSTQLAEKRSYLKKSLETFIANGDIQGYKNVVAEIEGLRAQLKDAKKPYNEKMRPLRKAVKLLDTMIIPSALKELGADTTPRFSLSQWVADRLAAQKKKK